MQENPNKLDFSAETEISLLKAQVISLHSDLEFAFKMLKKHEQRMEESDQKVARLIYEITHNYKISGSEK